MQVRKAMEKVRWDQSMSNKYPFNTIPAEIIIKLEFLTGLLLKSVFWPTNRADDCKQPSQANYRLQKSPFRLTG